MTYINFFQLSANEIKGLHNAARTSCDGDYSLQRGEEESVSNKVSTYKIHP